MPGASAMRCAVGGVTTCCPSMCTAAHGSTITRRKPARGGITARPGQTIRLLATLTPDGGGPVRIRGLNVTVPADASGATGTITVRGGNEFVEPTTAPATFDELLASFRETPRSNEVIATLGLDDGEGGTTTVQTVRKATPEVADGRFDFALTVS